MDNFADYIANNIQLSVDPNKAVSSNVQSITDFVCVLNKQDSDQQIKQQLDTNLPSIRRRIGRDKTVVNVDIEMIYDNQPDTITMVFDIDYV